MNSRRPTTICQSRSRRSNHLAVVMLLTCVTTLHTLSAQETPRVLDDRMQLTLFASEPDIVTPTGATFDHQERLLVIESHTHQRPKNYEGPESDRIRIIEDTDGDGKADRFRTFYEGTEHTMSIRRGPDNWIYVATRARVFRIRDTDNDDVADDKQTLVYLDTKGNYPHNGLSGLALDSENNLYFGMGENLGVPYRMIGKDGIEQTGSGEGGVFRCDADGNNLSRIATGFWNPFGICVDPVGRIFAVGNDADGRPPSRLVQIVETGDYGFQYRYGRSGIHPLQAWDGELPGTLPMVTGTGEAPCELVVHNGRLVTGSWGDFRVERYELVPVGASFQARREIVVQGDENFRPVAFTEAADGSLYFTDWVDKSYPVHGKGRIWRLSWKQTPAPQQVPALSDAERQGLAANLTVDWDALGSNDRFLQQQAIIGLYQSPELKTIEWDSLANPQQKVSLLQALRWKLDHAVAESAPAPLAILERALADSDPQVRLLAVRWVADGELKSLRKLVEKQLTDFDNTSSELFQASVATLEFLDTGKTTFDPKNTLTYFTQTLTDNNRSAEMKAMALRMIPIAEVGKALSVDTLGGLVDSPNPRLQREAIRTMALADHPDARAALSEFIRIRTEQQNQADDLLLDAMSGNDTLPKNPDASNQPTSKSVEEWIPLVEAGGDANAGWRVFHRAGKLNCATCHSVNGRGARIGPELTGIVSRTSRRDVLESILHPSRNIAPKFVSSIMVTADGKTLTGLWQGHDPDGKLEVFLDSDGKKFTVDPDQIDERRTSEISVMPDDLHSELTVQQIRDLLAFLESQ